MATSKETLMDWLRDAHAMEGSLVTLQERQLESLDGPPSVKGRIEEHLEATRQHEEKLKSLIEQLGGDTSAVKEGAGTVFSNLQAMMTAGAPDMLVKISIANYAVEQFEMAAYKSLIAAAQELGMSDVEQTCRENIQQEEEMAKWLDEHLAQVTREYLQKEATPQA